MRAEIRCTHDTHLPARQQTSLSVVATSASNREIPQRTYISENTVKFHLKNIYGKLGVTNRVQAILRFGSLESEPYSTITSEL